MNEWQPTSPHNGLPPLPPSDFALDDEGQNWLMLARVELARLQEWLAAVPSTNALVAAIPIVECQASSEIENIVTTKDHLFQRVANEKHVGDQLDEVWANRTALLTGYSKVRNRPISQRLAQELCSLLLGHQVEIRSGSGTYIGNAGHVVYTPPTGRQVIEGKLNNLEVFLNIPDEGAPTLDPLVKMAIAHYQFEAIHPFHDGNGRTGRMLNVLYLVQAGLIDAPVLHMSRIINERREEYYRLLLAVTSEGNWKEWISFMLQVVCQSATLVLSQMKSLESLRTKAKEKIEDAGLKPELAAGLALLAFTNPYFRQSDLAEKFKVSRPTLTKWAKLLIAIEIVSEQQVGRDKYYINDAMLRVLA
jgi:Fic family protein